MKTFKGKAIYNPAGKRKTKHSDRVKSNGYYAVYLPEHPFAFGKGYVYEHRHIIELQIGRYLDSYEIVHHKDGNKLNNITENLELCSSIAEHKLEHRGVNSKQKRLPSESNVLIECACGCQKKFMKYDKYGRERKYFSFGCVVRHKRIIRQKEQSKILTSCSCGCGTIICKYDRYGRERKYISGHNNTKKIIRHGKMYI